MSGVYLSDVNRKIRDGMSAAYESGRERGWIDAARFLMERGHHIAACVLMRRFDPTLETPPAPTALRDRVACLIDDERGGPVSAYALANHINAIYRTAHPTNQRSSGTDGDTQDHRATRPQQGDR
jgi:hypothetical protein